MTSESRAAARTGAPTIDLAAEAWLIHRLGDHGRHVEDGVTDVTVRRERIRAAILEGTLDTVVVGRAASGKPETYAEAFERLYGEPLAPASSRGVT